MTTTMISMTMLLSIIGISVEASGSVAIITFATMLTNLVDDDDDGFPALPHTPFPNAPQTLPHNF